MQSVSVVAVEPWAHGGGARGYDAGKKIKGRKRHLLTDSNGLLVAATVHPADIQDRDGAVPLLASIRHRFPWLRHVFADGGYAGAKLQTSLSAIGRWTLEIVKRSDVATASSCCPGGGSSSAARVAQPEPPPRQGLRDPGRRPPPHALLASVKLLLRRLARG